MTSTTQELVGRPVYARDGVKIGEIKEAVFGGEYVVIRRSLLSRLVAPIRAIEISGDRLTIPRTSMYLDGAPKVDSRHDLSDADRARLERFFMLKAA